MVALTAVCACAQGTDSSFGPAKFLGERSCSSSSCHGGAGNNRDQYIVWSKYDYHHARPFATLETARAERIAGALNLGDPARSPACTVCHAPFQTVPSGELAEGVEITQGVSCESCHGRAEKWLRGHTRHDWSHPDRVHAGMRDLKNLYVRANTCAACHQTLESNIRRAGHPELIFELDGQAVSQPRHWPTHEDKPGPQIWLVGQAAALREMSWQLVREKTSDPDLTARWAALVWLLQLAGQAESHLPTLEAGPMAPTPERLEAVRRWSDQFAKATADFGWSEGLTRKSLALLANTSDAFTDQKISNPIHARRAERLVLALDRLLAALGDAAASSASPRVLDRLFDDVQSLPDFDPKQFAKDVQQLRASASGLLGSN